MRFPQVPLSPQCVISSEDVETLPSPSLGRTRLCGKCASIWFKGSISYIHQGRCTASFNTQVIFSEHWLSQYLFAHNFINITQLNKSSLIFLSTYSWRYCHSRHIFLFFVPFRKTMWSIFFCWNKKTYIRNFGQLRFYSAADVNQFSGNSSHMVR